MARDAGGRAQSFRARARDGECRLGNAVTGACEQPARRALLVGVCCQYRRAHALRNARLSLRELPSCSRCCADGYAAEVGSSVAGGVGYSDCERYTPNGAHQPPASCARQHGERITTTSPLHRRPDTTDGKSTSTRDATQAPDTSERGAVAGRLHAVVSRDSARQFALLH